MELSQINIIFSLLVLIISVVIHEVSHGYMAYILGDPTAKLAGRLTLNPVKHIDPIGSVFVPLILYFLNSGFLFGWAKPVPYNPYNLKVGRFGPAYVALAGPGSNLFLALVFGLIIRLGPGLGLVSPEALGLLTVIVGINIMLALFNMIPIPPLDGSTVLLSLLPYKYRKLEEFFYRYQIVFLLAAVLVAGVVIDKLHRIIFYFITGL